MMKDESKNTGEAGQNQNLPPEVAGLSESGAAAGAAENGSVFKEQPGLPEEEEEQKKKKRRILLIILIILIILLLLGVIGYLLWLLLSERPGPDIDPGAADWVDQHDYGEKLDGEIAIPGFHTMEMQAGETAQQVTLFNPQINTCYFRFTIHMPDGSMLWQSKLVPPGKGLFSIELSEPLSAGTYNASLEYECFAMDDDLSPLNGATVDFVLNVE